jgi:hypothetical protein
VQVIEWTRAAMSREDKQTAEKLWKEPEQERSLLGEQYRADDVERDAELSQATRS